MRGDFCRMHQGVVEIAARSFCKHCHRDVTKEAERLRGTGFLLQAYGITRSDVVGIMLMSLSEDERLAAIQRFCRGCGRDEPGCQCQNDE